MLDAHAMRRNADATAAGAARDAGGGGKTIPVTGLDFFGFAVSGCRSRSIGATGISAISIIPVVYSLSPRHCFPRCHVLGRAQVPPTGIW